MQILCLHGTLSMVITRLEAAQVIFEEPSGYAIDKESIALCLAKISLLDEHKNKSKRLIYQIH